jgi:hypothetical protein
MRLQLIVRRHRAMTASRGWLVAAALTTVALPVRGTSPVAEGLEGGGRGEGGPRPRAVVRASVEASAYHDTDHVTVATPTLAASVSDPVGGWSLGGSYLVDAVSAASVDIVSSASSRWTERRHVAAGNFRYKPHDVGVEAGGGVSREPDYLAIAFGGSLSWDFLEKNFTAVLGYSLGDETAGRAGTAFSVFSHRVSKSTPRLGVTIVLGPRSVLDMVAETSLERGDQSKPYRYVPLFSAAAAARIQPGTSAEAVNALRLQVRPAERLPLQRNRHAFTARLSHRFVASTLRLEQRAYADDWGLKASTTDLRYIIDVGRSVLVWPHVRMHIQTPVAFWRRAYDARLGPAGQILDLPALRTGDRELGPLRTITAGGGLRLGIDGAGRSTWTITLQGDVVYTRYKDTLFIGERLAFFGALGLERLLE